VARPDVARERREARFVAERGVAHRGERDRGEQGDSASRTRVRGDPSAVVPSAGTVAASAASRSSRLHRSRRRPRSTAPDATTRAASAITARDAARAGLGLEARERAPGQRRGADDDLARAHQDRREGGRRVGQRCEPRGLRPAAGSVMGRGHPILRDRPQAS